ncbi:SET domain-containing protein 4 isoform X2 [Xiphias gladius]|uniref:SET domain-containing protein 4 isoform X2 n=1 Tax=Xiphias gladius TaxID=8245 RepID=UPI001A984FFE|nr:SET domain-containing protein 4 isoform X2 [Xiphias gladius]XP_039994655.1 SET domain-containing protein 4 isoform X2 [Xiphias gladius]
MRKHCPVCLSVSPAAVCEADEVSSPTRIHLSTAAASPVHRRSISEFVAQPDSFGVRCVMQPGQLVISLPEHCLLTTSAVLNSYLGQYFKSWKRRLSPLLALCVFLVCERHRGEASDWLPYIDVLPATYTCPACFPDDVMAVLPTSVRRRAAEQREAVREIHSSNQDFFGSLQPILSRPVEEVLTYEAVRWAWCSVNTRSVFMSQPSNDFLSGEDVYALAPFLDLLNHRPDVQVKASFNDVTRCYEIRSVSGTLRYQQAFINYGSHDNQRLLLEYGFVAPGNPHSVVYVDTDLLCDVLRGDRSLNQKIKFLKGNNLLHNLTVSSEGPSWRLMTALRLLSMPQTLYHQWKAVLLGQAVCEEREEWSIRTAKTLCQRLLQDTHTALDKISDLLRQRDQSVREQLDVVRSLRLEERCILGRCLEVLQGMMKHPDEPLTCQPDVDTVS